MNERILELAEQAGYKPLSPPTLADELNEIFMRKFAELIVQECASIIESQDVDPAFRHRMAWAVKQRFGVEE
jgi:hypothetical protein